MAKAPSVGSVIDKLWALRERKRMAEETVSKIADEITKLEEIALTRLDAEQVTSAKGAVASLSVTTNVVGNVTDWDEFWKFVIKTKNTHLLQRRISDPAFRELLELGKKVPGVQPFNKRRLNLRTLS